MAMSITCWSPGTGHPKMIKKISIDFGDRTLPALAIVRQWIVGDIVGDCVCNGEGEEDICE